MFFERTVGTRNLLTTIMTLSLQLWNLTGTALEHQELGNKAAGEFCIAGNRTWLSRLPQSQKTMYMFSKAYCYYV
jgi:hypothetical protein